MKLLFAAPKDQLGRELLRAPGPLQAAGAQPAPLHNLGFDDPDGPDFDLKEEPDDLNDDAALPLDGSPAYGDHIHLRASHSSRFHSRSAMEIS